MSAWRDASTFDYQLLAVLQLLDRIETLSSMEAQDEFQVEDNAAYAILGLLSVHKSLRRWADGGPVAPPATRRDQLRDLLR